MRQIRFLPAGAAGLLAVVVLAAHPAAGPDAAQAWTLSSPQGRIAATIRRSPAGRITIAATGDARAQIGIRVDGPTGAVRVDRRRVDDAFETVAGKRRRHGLHARLLTLRMPGGRRLEVLAADDGVAVRESGLPAPTFSAPAGSTAWLQRSAPNYEGFYRKVALGAARGAYNFPALIAAGGGWALLSEAGFGASHLTAAAGRLTVSGAVSSWRLAVLGSLGDIVASDLSLSLGHPSRISDTSWIRPGRVAWSWWSDSKSPARPDVQRRFVDAAAAHGWEYVLVDAGWKGAWVPDLVRYADARGVRILLWTDWHPLADPVSRRRLLDRWASWGVAGIKVDYLLSDRRDRVALYYAIARDAAARRLVVNFHGSTLPRGIQREWPNVLTLEAVRGAEYFTFGRRPTAAHDVDLVFTRNPVGSMDYTPATFSARNRSSTVAHVLAEAVAFESGLQHLADDPDAYTARPAADAILRALPVAWDDTRLIGGAPDRYATIARRHGADWWVADLSAGPPATRAVPLGFLDHDRRYTATITADDGPDDLRVTRRTVTATDTLTVPVAADGGFTVQLTPAG